MNEQSDHRYEHYDGGWEQKGEDQGDYGGTGADGNPQVP